jgi:hypothetical protein
MFLAECSVLELCVIRYVVMSFIYKLVVLVLFCVSITYLLCLYCSFLFALSI